MAIIISQIKTTLDEPKDNAVAKALSLLRLSRAETASAKLYKSSVDARRDICFVNSVYIAMNNEEQDVKKKIMMVVGACIFLIAAAQALPLFFGLS